MKHPLLQMIPQFAGVRSGDVRRDLVSDQPFVSGHATSTHFYPTMLASRISRKSLKTIAWGVGYPTIEAGALAMSARVIQFAKPSGIVMPLM